jgi:mono/diheme cytochrome c family protein
MRDPRPTALGLLATVFFIVAWTPPAAARTGNAVRGRVLAIEACTACHKVTRGQNARPPVHNPDTLEDVAAPDFAEIHHKYRRHPSALRAFILAPAHPMREQRFLRRDLEDIVAYIRSRSATW